MITNLRSIWRMAWLERALRDILQCNAVSFSTYIFLNKRLKFSVASKFNEKSPFWSVCDNI